MIFQAKLEYDKTLNSTPVNSKARIGPEGIKVAPRSAFKRELLSNHLLRDRFGLLKDQLTDFPGFMLGIKDPSMKSNGLRNPFDIPRHSLLDQLVRMRANFLQVSREDPQILVNRAQVGDLLCHLAKYNSHSIFRLQSWARTRYKQVLCIEEVVLSTSCVTCVVRYLVLY